jgi:creatinine amidohydrolase
MRLQDLNWMDVERYLERDNRIILITGATEQHAYLSLWTDILIPSEIAEAAAERENVLVAPPLNFGMSEYFIDFPGTITLSQSTFGLVLSEMVDSLVHQGFQRFFILNGHGGNQQPQHLIDLDRDQSISVVWYDWWRESAVKKFSAERGLQLNHANWGENFPFNRVTESPKEVKPQVILDALNAGQSMRQVLGDGSYGGEYQVDDAIMEAMFARVVDEVVEKLRAL